MHAVTRAYHLVAASPGEPTFPVPLNSRCGPVPDANQPLESIDGDVLILCVVSPLALVRNLNGMVHEALLHPEIRLIEMCSALAIDTIGAHCS